MPGECRTVLHMDLDNTIIYSYKHEIGGHRRCVERYQGREISFITEKTYELLRQVKKRMLIVPTSTRTTEQYRRIDLEVGDIPYALVCNGGVLLVDGEPDREWYCDSLEKTEGSRRELDYAAYLLEREPGRNFELRLLEGLFLFTKCRDAEVSAAKLKRRLDLTKVRVFHNGTKLYVVPVDLSKGNAVKRFRKYIGADMVIAAGDSEFDISMLAAADLGLAPHGFGRYFRAATAFKEAGEGELFSEYVLTECMKGW